MRLYIADDGDSLEKISRKFHVELSLLLSLNSKIPSSDTDISGKPVNLPQKNNMNEEKIVVTPSQSSQDNVQEQWIPLTSLDEMEQTFYDVIIVGTGAGGGAALWRLCEQLRKTGKRIGVVEAGDLLSPMHVNNLPTMTPERAATFFLNRSRPVPNYDTREVIALGGRTLFWLGISPRMHPSEMSTWPISFKDMDFYYNIAEKVMNVTKDYTKESSLTQVLLKRLQENGFSDATDQPMATNLQKTKYGEIFSNVFYSSMSMFGRALNLHPFDLAIKARAVKVLTERDKVLGVEVMSPEKKLYFLKANTVILSASTFQTPRILLHSGIKGPAIGHYLTNHSRVFATGIVKRKDFPEVLGTLGILIPGTEKRPYQIQIIGPGSYFWYQYTQEKPLENNLEIQLHASGVVNVQFNNRVTLDPLKCDEFGVPEINVHFAYSNRDQAVINQMNEALFRASRLMKATLIPIDQQLSTLWPPGQELHEMGTCRMGDDPLTSATNRFGQIHGISGLYIADNSVIPTSGTANPVLTTVALAIRTADHIAKQIK